MELQVVVAEVQQQAELVGPVRAVVLEVLQVMALELAVGLEEPLVLEQAGELEVQPQVLEEPQVLVLVLA